MASSFAQGLSAAFRCQRRIASKSIPSVNAAAPIYRSMNTDAVPKTNIQSGFLPLLLPETPTGKVAPVLDKAEIDNLMKPLHQRTWTIQKKTPDDGFNQKNEESPFLTRKIRFKGPVSARTFVTELMRIENEEQHHISFSLWSGKRPIVTISTQTHSAQVGDETRPAITSRDIRLAVRLESFLDESQLMFKGGRVEVDQAL